MAEAAPRVPAAAPLAAPGRYGRAGGEPGVVLAERAGLALAAVAARLGKAGPAAAAARAAFGIELPATPRLVEGEAVSFLWAGPDQWLALSGSRAGEAPLEGLLSGVFDGLASVSDQSGGRRILRIAGAGARAVLAKGLTIDLHPRAFRPGDTALTLAAHIELQIWQVDGVPTYDIAVPRSLARSFWHFLAEAAGEHGYLVRAPGDGGPERAPPAGG
jgi:sarcosine oxidase subunit gamma